MSKWINTLGEINEDIIESLEDCGFSRSASHLLAVKGIHNEHEALDFFDLSLKKLHDPYDLPNVHAAINRIKKAIRNNEKVFIWGDYDVDGITSTAVVITALNKFNANYQYHIPHRIYDGYDIKKASIDKVIESGATLLITVDCGILAFEAAEYAKKKGIDLIITDHHTPSDDKRIPSCVAVINPKISWSEYPFQGLAGVGIAFKFMAALANELGYPLKDLMKDTIEYVALGTVADVAPMIDENRILVHAGCSALNKSTKPGINALMKVSRVNKLSSTNIGFSVAPRLNASGRLDDPLLALKLLITHDDEEALILANELEGINLQRQKIQEEAFDKAIEIVNDKFNPHDDKCIVLCDKSWPMGVVGLIAGKLAETFSVPTLVGHIKSDGFIKGSCRSSQGIDILRCLKSPKCHSLFKQKPSGDYVLGGHAFAAGFEIHKDNIDELRTELSKYINDNYQDLTFDERVFYYDLSMNISEINKELFSEILKFSPFGADNVLPVFMVKNAVIDSISTVSSGKHLKLLLKSEDIKGFANYNKINAMWWRNGDKIQELAAGDKIKIIAQPDLSSSNEYMLSLFIMDLKTKK